jgi:hypothetical protein
MAKEALLDHVALPSSNVHRISGELEPALAAAEYEQTLRSFFTARAGKTRFDLILLGMGDDGHTASLFPDTEALDESERLVVANHVPKLDTWRITLTVPVINDAAYVAFLIAGAGKAGVLKRVLQGPRQSHELPSQMIQPVDGELVWLRWTKPPLLSWNNILACRGKACLARCNPLKCNAHKNWELPYATATRSTIVLRNCLGHRAAGSAWTGCDLRPDRRHDPRARRCRPGDVPAHCAALGRLCHECRFIS